MINSRKTDDAVRRRRVAHDGLTTGALWPFCVALLLPIVTLSDPYDRGMEGAFILPAKGFLTALPLGAAIRQQGLSSAIDATQRGPVTVTKNGRAAVVVMSVKDYERRR